MSTEISISDRACNGLGEYQAYLSDDVLLSGVELGALVYVCPAGSALDAHGEHHAHLDLLVLGLPPSRDLRRVEIRRVILVQHLTFTHLAGTLKPNPT